jgi:hypothetical protein
VRSASCRNADHAEPHCAHATTAQDSAAIPFPQDGRPYDHTSPPAFVALAATQSAVCRNAGLLGLAGWPAPPVFPLIGAGAISPDQPSGGTDNGCYTWEMIDRCQQCGHYLSGDSRRCEQCGYINPSKGTAAQPDCLTR